MSNNFYVYEHWRLDRDECFYVGKGTGRRAYNMCKRGAHHKAIQKKLHREGSSIEVRIVADGLTEQQVFNLEIERIAFWKNAMVDIINITSGGIGGATRTGATTPPDVRAKMRAAKLGKKRSPETCAKISAAAKLRGPPKLTANDYLRIGAKQKGKILSAEHREKLSLSKRGRKLTDAHKEALRQAWFRRKALQL